MSGRQRRRARRADLSQHFLRKGATAARLVRRTLIDATDLVVEIGAGRGALTHHLADRAGRVIAVELDARLAAALENRVASNVVVVPQDFLEFELPSQPYVVFGNVPYARTSDIVRKLTEAQDPPSDAWLVTQQEAAYRFIGAPYRHETLWSLRLKPFWQLEVIDRLRRTDFDPPPAVDSVMLWLARRSRPLLTPLEETLWTELLTHGFGSGETLHQGMRRWLTKTQLKRLATDLKFSVEDRAPSLAFEQWLGILRFLCPPGSR